MAEQVTRVTQVGFFSKLMESIKGVVGGGVIFLIAFPLIFWNECNSVEVARSLAAGRDQVVEVPADPIEPGNEGALVHFTGEAVTTDTLTDANFGVSLTAIKLRRNVEMYQWKETERTERRQKVGGGEERVTTYSYTRVWSDQVIDSSRFHEVQGHVNPGEMAYESVEYVAQNVTVGAFSLSPDLVAQMDRWESLTIDDATLASLPEALRGRAKAAGGRYYFGSDPANPRVGDLRVSFEVVHPATVSIIAEQRGAGTQAWTAPNGRTLALLEYGTRSPDEMFASAEAANRMLTWVLRLVSYVMMFAGLSAVFRPFAVLAGVVPIFGRMVSFFAGLVAAALALVLWCVTVALAWLAVRPLLAIFLLLVAAIAFVGFLVLMVMLIRAIRNRAPAPEPQAAAG